LVQPGVPDVVQYSLANVVLREEEAMGIVVPIHRVETSGKPKNAANRSNGHTVSLHLTEIGYRCLRKYILDTEAATGHRVTHQAVLETALAEFLSRSRGSAA
jgi:hypothetical protein